MWRKKKWAGYGIYCLLLLCALLYYRVPSQALGDYLASAASAVDSRYALEINSIRPWFPLGLRFKDTTLSLKSGQQGELVRSEDILLTADFWSSLKDRPRCLFKAKGYNGTLKGHIDFESIEFLGPVNTTATIKGLDMAGMTYLQEVSDRSIEGELDGRLSYEGNRGSFIDGTAKVDLRLKDVWFEYLSLHPKLRLEAVDLGDITIEMAMERRNVNISRLEIKGKAFQGSLTGNIAMGTGIGGSSISLKGMIKPSATLLEQLLEDLDTAKLIKQRMRRGNLPLTIYGTLKEPKINIT